MVGEKTDDTICQKKKKKYYTNFNKKKERLKIKQRIKLSIYAGRRNLP